MANVNALKVNVSLSRTTRHLVLLSVVVFLSFLSIGVPLPVLPLYVSGDLYFGSWVIGIVMGGSAIVTLLTRVQAGRLADAFGSKKIVLCGIACCVLSSVANLLSLADMTSEQALAILLMGRVLLGCGESMVMTGAIAWGISLVGKTQVAKVISWLGLAMYSATMVVGAPLGGWALDYQGLVLVFIFSLSFPLLGFVISLPLPAVPVLTDKSNPIPLSQMLRIVAIPGVIMGLGAVGFAIVSAYLSLLYLERAWENVGFSLMALGIAYVVMRLFFLSTIQRFGAMQVVMAMLLTEAVGQILIWQAVRPEIALLGSMLTGVGYSLILPACSVIVVRYAPEQARSAIMGLYLAFFDFGLGASVPIIGAILSWNELSYATAFLFSSVAIILAFFIAQVLWQQGKKLK